MYKMNSSDIIKQSETKAHQKTPKKSQKIYNVTEGIDPNPGLVEAPPGVCSF